MSQLPEPVLQAIQRGDHDQAIRMLSLNQGVSPQAAQEQINTYLDQNPPIRMRGAGIIGLSRTNALIWLGLIALMVVVYLVLMS
ncbi:hypothetical protein [Pseudomonas sp. EA_35y_Pfl2_R5]|uniref:hypothetical protein n=1 Tax=Pseudomonas sp. EA_35y_Pfl2_R5 TaxID=3088690 RepID=UPI0030D8E675